jgi:nudix-type nucleoside diphosphatase (YffH/AdpP family)
MVWFPPPQTGGRGPLWSLADWQAAHGPLARTAAPDAMALMGRMTPARMAHVWRMIAARAQARLVAAQAPDAGLSGLARADVVQVAQRRPYDSFYGLAEYDLRLRQFDTTLGPQIERGVLLSADAALVLPYDPVRDTVLLVEQFRIGPYARGAAFPWCLEPIAGIIDGGETAETTARREALEEANLVVDRLIPIGAGYSSPGDSTNHFHLFCAPCDLPDAAAGVGGLASEAENIRSHVLSFARFMALLDGGHLNVIPLQVMGHWLARHRDALRAAA